MKRFLLLTLVVLFSCSQPTRQPTPTAMLAPVTGSKEQYGTTPTGVSLYWTAYVRPGVGKHPAVLVLHPGGFKTGEAGPQNVALDLANAGFLALATEYRLAPPHAAMNTPQHPAPAQNTVNPVDDGHYPAQTDDVRRAIRAARRDPRCNGLVYCIGGSAGGSHTVYWLARGTAGDDRPDLGVDCSGPCNFEDTAWYAELCVSGNTCAQPSIENYIGIPTGSILSHMSEVTAASPSTYITSALPPVFIIASNHDAQGIVKFCYNDLVATVGNKGLTESTAAVPEKRKFKKLLVEVPDDGQTYHAFGYWSKPITLGNPVKVKDVIIAWLTGGPPPP